MITYNIMLTIVWIAVAICSTLYIRMSIKDKKLRHIIGDAKK